MDIQIDGQTEIETAVMKCVRMTHTDLSYHALFVLLDQVEKETYRQRHMDAERERRGERDKDQHRFGSV